MGDLGRPTLCTAPWLKETLLLVTAAIWVGRTPELVIRPGLILFNTTLSPAVGPPVRVGLKLALVDAAWLYTKISLLLLAGSI